MAIDQALLESVQGDGQPVLRLYRWAPACLSLGRNQPANAAVRALRTPTVDLVRRPTGGLAVLHDEELTYAVVVKSGAVGSPREVYHAINRGLLRGLAVLGAMAEVTAHDSATSAFTRNGSCFASTAPGELIAAGRKLVGSAQRCERHTILQHGSILLAGDQSITFRDLVGSVPDWPRLTAAIATGVAAELGILLAPGSLTEFERERALQLVEFFDSDGWTWRV